ncbi:MAG: hypothetical protein AVDCRST_MAG43-2033 [uncultured Thermomicrobiales bacterium]|uniref:Uncharacterized protein n=1 Tax=uncultured Thermomicrobiales bacterium TaxID=1645740 RepID=A0A6J4UWF5_9BACT|nr:MAG: hypothetical protein AVDCRST_MAG43-2033 [uncultured Thermomicrobiales bacterium]
MLRYGSTELAAGLYFGNGRTIGAGRRMPELEPEPCRTVLPDES